jgi:hypothetical protein
MNSAAVDKRGRPLDGTKGLTVDYTCPSCGHDWEEQWSCACNSQCPECGATDIEAREWELDGTATQDALDAFNAVSSRGGLPA